MKSSTNRAILSPATISQTSPGSVKLRESVVRPPPARRLRTSPPQVNPAKGPQESPESPRVDGPTSLIRRLPTTLSTPQTSISPTQAWPWQPNPSASYRRRSLPCSHPLAPPPMSSHSDLANPLRPPPQLSPSGLCNQSWPSKTVNPAASPPGPRSPFHSLRVAVRTWPAFLLPVP